MSAVWWREELLYGANAWSGWTPRRGVFNTTHAVYFTALSMHLERVCRITSSTSKRSVDGIARSIA